MAKKCDALEIQTDPVQAPLEILAKMMAAFGAKLVELPADPMARVPMRLASFRSHEITYSPSVSESLASDFDRALSQSPALRPGYELKICRAAFALRSAPNLDQTMRAFVVADLLLVTKECSFFHLQLTGGSLVQAILRHPKMVGFSFRPECVKRFIYLRQALRYFNEMRGVGIIIIAFLVLSVTVQGQPHVVLRPTGPLPAVNVP